ncbi:LexA family transcriptional regulator [Citrobacter freundii]|uniref:LexA family transcriptional regulator n=1 Tax=Citrobacter freundii TaxID=546 RepID=UPI003A877CBC
MSRYLTDEQKKDAQRLKSIYQSKKKELGLSQASVADQMGITQSAIGHYINGRQPLNARAVSALARILQVGAEDISPTLSLQIAQQARSLGDSVTLSEMSRRVMVIGRVIPGDNGASSGLVHTTGFLKIDDDRSSFAVEVSGNSLWPRIKNGEFVVVEKQIAPEPGDDVLLQLKNGTYLFKSLVSIRGEDVQLSDISGKSAFPELQKRDEIEQMYLISAIVKSSRYFQ